MKRAILSYVVFFLIMTFTAHSQNFLKEPLCACDDAEIYHTKLFSTKNYSYADVSLTCDGYQN